MNENNNENMQKKSSGTKTFLKVFTGIILFLAIGAGGFFGGMYLLGEDGENKENAETQMTADGEKKDNVSEETVQIIEKAETTKSDSDTEGSEDAGGITKVVENVMPAIVSIDCEAYMTSMDMFGREYSSRGQGSGSGIIIGQNEKEVLIVTKAHVVSGDRPSVSVTFIDEQTIEASIKGVDTASDIAVVAVEMEDLESTTKEMIKVATLGSSDDSKVGQVAIAIGNALGYGQSVTVGYISAKERQIDLEDSSQSMSLLQTDAAINPGNSGGALLNIYGEIIGINSAKFSSTDVEGMGYAIPISDALPIITALMNEEEVEHKKAYLGIVGVDVGEGDSKSYNMPEGIYIREITDDSPAAKGGLLIGDIIIKCNGNEMKTMQELENFLARSEEGDVLVFTVVVRENGSFVEQEKEVTLGSKTESSETKNESYGNSPWQ